MRLTRQLVLPLALCCLCSACTHYYYAPNTLYAPHVRQQHDTQASLGIIGGDEFNGWEGHALYSPVKYAAVMVNHFQVRSRVGAGSSDPDWGKGHLSEIALGGYLPFSEINTFSLFGGWGGGRVVNYYDANGRADLRFQRWFLQPNFTAQGQWARFGLSCRLNWLEYLQGDITFDIGDQHLETIRNIEENTPLFIPEVGLSFGFGHKPIWFDFHFNFNIMPDKQTYGFARSTVGLSLHCDIDHFWRPGGE
ncbi:MAG: hypothetical protein JNK89_10915 [Saprospiraceae bacterium]|nr:hypothetical protein [Saprospiraceae bacterium]